MKTLAIIALVLAALIAVEAFVRRGKTRPLANRFARTQAAHILGQEAVDTEGFARALRRNGAWGKMPQHALNWRNSGGDGLQHEIEPLPDDTSYAARWHRAFGKNKETME